MHAFFKKRDKAFVGYCDDAPAGLEDDTYLYKDVKDTDPMLFKWVGDYDTGKLVSIDSKDVKLSDYSDSYHVYESDIKKETENRIVNTHNLPIHKQINIMFDQINIICDKLKVKKSKEFSSATEIISAELKNMKKQIKFNRDNPDKFKFIETKKYNEFMTDQFV
tara:strand:+ start:1445 stop:1936 length:492 start_codon:yes stop_codon:yes gene_type:complete